MKSRLHVLAFVVLLFVVAVCSTVAAGCVSIYCAHCTCLHVCGTWDRPTNRVRTIDRVRVNGW